MSGDSEVANVRCQAFIPGGAFLTPTSVLSARFAKLSMQLDF